MTRDATSQDTAPFTADDYAARMASAARTAADAGLAGLLIAPGPDLAHLTGYRPTAETERLTLLVLGPRPVPEHRGPAQGAPRPAHAAGAPPES
ncbi:peptidase M24 family protein, partial [Streptomyces sp. NPDC059385]